MLYSLRGILIHTEPALAVIECGGVGYKCLTTLQTQRALPKLNEEVTVFTHLNVREDAVELFGFATMQELNCFKMLTSVSGVGPKAALAVLSELSSGQLAMAVASGDTKSITKAQGVGPKIAQRIILELKDKIKGLQGTDNGSVQNPNSAEMFDGNVPKAVSALAVLGYSSADVMPVLSRLDSSMTTEQMISAVLKEMGRP